MRKEATLHYEKMKVFLTLDAYTLVSLTYYYKWKWEVLLWQLVIYLCFSVVELRFLSLFGLMSSSCQRRSALIVQTESSDVRWTRSLSLSGIGRAAANKPSSRDERARLPGKTHAGNELWSLNTVSEHQSIRLCRPLFCLIKINLALRKRDKRSEAEPNWLLPHVC